MNKTKPNRNDDRYNKPNQQKSIPSRKGWNCKMPKLKNQPDAIALKSSTVKANCTLCLNTIASNPTAMRSWPGEKNKQ